ENDVALHGGVLPGVFRGRHRAVGGAAARRHAEWERTGPPPRSPPATLSLPAPREVPPLPAPTVSALGRTFPSAASGGGARGRFDAHVLPGLGGGDPAARGAGDQAGADQERLGDHLDRLRLLPHR